jgi:hypothetical protein
VAPPPTRTRPRTGASTQTTPAPRRTEAAVRGSVVSCRARPVRRSTAGVRPRRARLPGGPDPQPRTGEAVPRGGRRGCGGPGGRAVPVRGGTGRATAASSAADRAAVLGCGRRRGHPGTPSAWGRRSRVGGAGGRCRAGEPCRAGRLAGRGTSGPDLAQSVAACGDRLQIRHGFGCVRAGQRVSRRAACGRSRRRVPAHRTPAPAARPRRSRPGSRASARPARSPRTAAMPIAG